MDERLCIRRATEADFPVLAEMTREFNDYLDTVGGNAAAEDAAETAAAAMNRLRPLAFGPQAVCTVLMAELDGAAAGYLNYYIGVYMDDATPTLHVADFFVRGHLRRQGVGRALMLEARRIAAALGASRLLWTVWRKNEDAIRFYASLGAEPDDDSVLMQWMVNR